MTRKLLPAVRAARAAVAACSLALWPLSRGEAQQHVTPALIAAHGLPVRADTVDAYIDKDDPKTWFGFYVYAVARTTITGKPAYLVTMDYTSKEKGTFQSDTLALDATTLNPFWRRFHARTDSASVTFSGHSAAGWALQNDRRVTVDHRLSDSAFAAPMLRWILPALPLAIGYQGAISAFNIWRNTEDRGLINVSASEAIDVGARKVDAWLLQSPAGAKTWVEKGTGRILRIFTPDSRNGYWLVRR
jgi:hypothetical protein